MKILVVGAGAREHSLAWRLACGAGDKPRADREIVVVPGNAGIARFFKCRPAKDKDQVMSAILDEQPDVVVIGPESYIDQGIVDSCLSYGIPCFGPSAGAAGLEASKVFMKEVARAAGVATADFVVARSTKDAEEFLESRRGKGVVIKADGLAAGKGVVVCDNIDDAKRELAAFLGSPGTPPRFGDASRTVVVEDRLKGDELSVFALCDGEDAVVLGAVRDHKRLRDGDRGPNTGGMGAVGPLGEAEGVSSSFLDDVRERFLLPVLKEMKARGVPFSGVLFAGLMMHEGAPQLLEFNVRFGDPETEVLMSAFDVDFAPLFLGIGQGKRLPKNLRFTPAHKVATVVVAAPGYPETPEKGAAITGVYAAERQPEARVFCAGVGGGSFGFVVDGGRVFAVTARGSSFDQALNRAYRAVDRIAFEGMQLRRDIGQSVRKR